MTKKRKSSEGFTFFEPPGPDDPVASFFAILANKVANYGIQRLSNKIQENMGTKAIEDPVETSRMNMLIQKQQAETAWAKARQQMAERQLKMVELKLIEKQAALERAKHQVGDIMVQKTDLSLRVKTELITGTLGVRANANGISGLVEQEEVYKDWLKRIADGGQILLALGKPGSGKSGFIAKVCECVMAIHNVPTCWVGLPSTAGRLLPSWVLITDTVEACPNGHLVVCDEAGLNFLSLNFRSQRNLFMRRLLMTCRQKNCSLLFAAQNSKDVDYSIVRLANAVALKEPSLNQITSERPEIRDKVKQAAHVFSELPKADRIQTVLIFNDDFQGLARVTLPEFWTNELSHIYSQVDLTSLDTDQNLQHRLLDTQTSKESDEDALNREIIRCRQKGDSYRTISVALRITIWRVRKALEGRNG